MEFNVDDKEFCKALAEMAVNNLQRYIENGNSTMFYDNQVSCVVKEKVDKIIKKNEDKILDMVVSTLAEKYMKQINLACV